MPTENPEKPTGAKEGREKTETTDAFVMQLAEEDRMLILLQRELYEGSWDAMLADLRNRLEGRPYIFKLANRIHDDIERIGKLQAFEKEHDIHLTDYVKPPGTTGSDINGA